jgi:hypothetical protein
MAAVVDTGKIAEHRTLRFNSLEELLAEVDRIVAAEQRSALRRTGNWTPGQVFGHLAAWINYGYEGFPPGSTPPWFVRVIVRMMKKSLCTKPMRRGFRMPRVVEGTYGTELLSTDEGARRLRQAIARLQRHEPPKYHSPALGPMSDDERIALNLRHAELHLGFLWP